jgi:outer membrane protein assembly factor BamB
MRSLFHVSLFFLPAPLLVASVMNQPATSWPMWGGTTARNMANFAERNIPAEWDVESKKNIKWIAQLGTQSYGNTVVADGKVFVGTNNDSPRNPRITGDKGVVMCFRQMDGEFLWQATHEKLPTGQLNDWPAIGVASSCAVDGKRLYYVSNRCTLVCVDTEGFRDGKNDGVRNEKHTSELDADFVWELDMINELHVYPHFLATSSPLVVGDLVFVHTSNGPENQVLGTNVPSPDAPSFIAVNKLTGKLIWQDNSPGDRLYDGQWSSPTYGVVNGKGQVYFPGGDGWLYAFEPLGDPDRPGKSKLIWKFDCNPPGAKLGRSGRGTANSILATAVFHINRVFISVGQNPEHGEGPGHLYCIDPTKTGDVSDFIGEWDEAERAKKNAAKNPNSALVWHYGDKDFGRSMSTVAIQGELLFAVELAGYLHCINLKTGEPYWKHDFLSFVWGSPSIIDNKVFVGDEDGDVCVFSAVKELNLIKELNMGNTIASTPIAAGGVLYIATRDRLFAIQQK